MMENKMPIMNFTIFMFLVFFVHWMLFDKSDNSVENSRSGKL